MWRTPLARGMSCCQFFHVRSRGKHSKRNYEKKRPYRHHHIRHRMIPRRDRQIPTLRSAQLQHLSARDVLKAGIIPQQRMRKPWRRGKILRQDRLIQDVVLQGGGQEPGGRIDGLQVSRRRGRRERRIARQEDGHVGLVLNLAQQIRKGLQQRRDGGEVRVRAQDGGEPAAEAAAAAAAGRRARGREGRQGGAGVRDGDGVGDRGGGDEGDMAGWEQADRRGGGEQPAERRAAQLHSVRGGGVERAFFFPWV